ncbi:MAG: macro domain-containing protein [Acidimicrobiales bacterium]
MAAPGAGGGTAIEAVAGDLVAQQVHVVVNAANAALAEGGGVCGAIFAAAGRADLRRACEELGGCRPGDAKATPGFALPARWIVHTVGPVWHGGHEGEDGILASCYRRSVAVAADLGARSIAFPAIATGIYGFPARRAAGIAVGTLREAVAGHRGAEDGVAGTLRLVRLVAFEQETLALYRDLLDRARA